MIGIGINTGTSADAIDIAIVKFKSIYNNSAGAVMPTGRQFFIKLLWSGAYSYPSVLKRLFLKLVADNTPMASTHWLEVAGRFDYGLGNAFADIIIKAVKSSGIGKDKIAFVGMHGQTVRHAPLYGRSKPSHSFKTGSTLQFGNPSVVAVGTGIPAVAHFRDKDVALGGQGAPLAPVLHYELFENYAPVIVLNIGGIANITVIPSADFSSVYGFDTGAGNRLIDIAVGIYTNGKRRFDRDGKLADKGKVDQNTLDELMLDAFIKKRPPKSTGREHYNKIWIDSKGIRLKRLSTITTLTAFTAHCIAYNIKRFVKEPVDRMIVCGGGADNPVIIRYLSELMPYMNIKTVNEIGYKPTVIEPMLFAFLGYTGFNKIPINLKHITGSVSAFIPGGIYYP